MKLKLNLETKSDTTKILPMIFFSCLILFGLLIILEPKKPTFSEIENRSLAAFPEVNLKTIENREAMNGIETYIADHFPERIFWVKTKTAIEMAIGSREINGVYISKERFIHKMPAADNENVNGNADNTNQFADSYDTRVYVMLVPTAAAIYSDLVPYGAPNFNQKEYLADVYDRLDGNITPVDIYDELYSKKDEYIYYRTDHHWNTAGAFIAYQKAGEVMGFEPLLEQDFEIEHATDEFLGSRYSNVLYDGMKADTIDIYTSPSGAEVTSVEISVSPDSEPAVYDDMYFREWLKTKNKYGVFFSGDQPFISIKSTAKGGKILVIKDSYANCFIPFLTNHYSEVAVLDLRYINASPDEYADINDFDSVLFLYNMIDIPLNLDLGDQTAG